MANKIDVSAIAKTLGQEHGVTLLTGDDPSYGLSKLQTGVLPFDVLLAGGLTRNRIAMMHGAPASLKTYLMLSCVRTVQAQGGLAAIIDTEHSYDSKWATHVGVDPKQLIVMQPDTGEQAQGIVEALLMEHPLDFLGWDSITATLTQEEASKAASETDKVATLARFTNRLCKRINSVNTNTAILLLSQERVNVGVTYGSNVSIPGGKAMKFYPSTIFTARSVGKEKIKADAYQHNKAVKVDHVSGEHFLLQISKDRSQALPTPVGFTWHTEAAQVDEVGFAIDYAVNKDIIEVDGKRFSWTAPDGTAVEGTEIWRFATKLRSNPAHCQALMEQVLLAACPHLTVKN